MSEVTLGRLIESTAERDAIHIAIAPVIAGERLAPGQHIGFIDKHDNGQRTVGLSSEPLGIVDPFLKHVVLPGQLCWLFLYPQSVTGMRHHWAHPAFHDLDNHSTDLEESKRDCAC